MKKFFLFLFLVFLNISFVSAELSDNLQGCWDFDNDLNDTFNERDGSSNGAPSFSTTVKKTGTHSLYLNDACNIEIADLTGTDYDFDTSFTLCIWSYMETHSATDYLFTQMEDGSNVAEILKHTDGDGFGFYQYSNPYVGNFPLTFGGEVTTTGWDMLCFATNGSNNYYFFKNTTGYFAVGTAIDKYVAPLSIGGNNANYYWDGYVDSFMRWNKTLTSAEITELWNSGNGMTCDEITTVSFDTPSLTLYTDLINGTVTNLSIQQWFFNGTSVNNSDIYSCDLLVNNSIEESKPNLDLGEQQNFSYTFTVTEEWTNITINCSNENATDNDTALYFVDVITPDVSISIINGSSYYDDVTLDEQVNCSDINLFAGNVTIVCDGSLVYWEFIDELSTTLYEFNITNETSDFGESSCNLHAYCWDSHTNSKVKPIDYKFEDGNIIIDDEINITGDIIAEQTEFILSEIGDRYKVEITFELDSTHHVFYIETTDKLSYIESSNYLGHFVYFPLKKWIDFESDNIKEIEIEEINKNKYKITIDLFESEKEIIFNSIGDLNEGYSFVTFDIEESPTLTDLYLIELINKTDTQNSLIDDVGEGVNMIAWIIMFIFLWILYFWTLDIRINDFTFIGFSIMIVTFANLENAYFVWFSFLGVALSLNKYKRIK